MLLDAAIKTVPVKPNKPIVVVVGATGTGKSQLAIDIAHRFNGEVINCDAMQMYQDFPIMTNKVGSSEMKGVPHHLLGVVGLHQEPWTVSQFVQNAQEILEDIHDRGRLPVLVGGTHYYLQSLLFRYSIASSTVKAIGPTESAENLGSHWHLLDGSTQDILKELKRVDPVMASRWHPNDRRKIRRSLEIYLQTGQKASDVYLQQRQQRQTDVGCDDPDKDTERSAQGLLTYPALLIWTHTKRDALTKRLDSRVDEMVNEGLLEEVSRLNATRLSLESAGSRVDTSRGIWVSIGFKEFKEYIVAQKQTTDTRRLDSLRLHAIERTKIATRQYAKSQLKWIRIKLLNALREARADESLFISETDDVSGWTRHAMRPVDDLVQAFLRGMALPPLLRNSPAATELLVPKQAYDLGRRFDLWASKTCGICGVTATTERLWNQHISSKVHRASLKRQNAPKDADYNIA